MDPREMIKSITRYVLLLIAFGLTSCDSEVSFTEPQPQDVKEARGFKRKFQGEFLSVSDTSLFQITKHEIVQKRHLELEADSFFSMQKKFATLNYQSDLDQVTISANADSTHFSIDIETRIFGRDSGNILKYDNGMYYLNFLTKDNFWDVQVIDIQENGNLVLRNLRFEKKDIEELRKITEVTPVKDKDGEIVRYHISPSSDELRKLVISNLVSVEEEFFRKER